MPAGVVLQLAQNPVAMLPGGPGPMGRQALFDARAKVPEPRREQVGQDEGDQQVGLAHRIEEAGAHGARQALKSLALLHLRLLVRLADAKRGSAPGPQGRVPKISQKTRSKATAVALLEGLAPTSPGKKASSEKTVSNRTTPKSCARTRVVTKRPLAISSLSRRHRRHRLLAGRGKEETARQAHQSQSRRDQGQAAVRPVEQKDQGSQDHRRRPGQGEAPGRPTGPKRSGQEREDHQEDGLQGHE